MSRYVINGHEYARDRAPYDDPIGLVRWRLRWTCSCGRDGAWTLRGEYRVYRSWASHAQQAGWQRQDGAGGGTMVRVPAIPRSTTHRTTR
jgi:hypothetical protein